MRFFSILLFCSFLILKANAAPGDTTWVQANINQLDYFNNFDTTVKFPDGSKKYRKIIMVFTLGKYVCPGTPTYCSDWDYTVQTYAMNKVGDTVELGRLITPYGKGARMPASWQQDYFFDVTDYTTVLRDSNKIRIHYSGYSGGFTANIRFAMIEGTPERDVIGIKSMWDGSFAFGAAANPIDAKVAAKTLTAPAGTSAATYRLNITGHGSDPNGCSEFCQKYYRVIKDGSMVKEKLIWRANCGLNNLYPQSGTWIYDRGNWCPGDLVHTNFHPLPGVTAGGNFDLGMTFEPYTSTGAAVYTIYGAVVYYGGMNKTLDASLDEIIAPTNYDGNFRENARIGYTTVKIRNTGSSVINNIQFSYGVTGQPMTTTTWSGVLNPLTDTVIDLYYAISLTKATGTNVPYEVNIVSVNSSTDNDATNNKLTTTFTPAPVWPTNITVIFRTNAASIGGVSETEWRIFDETGAIVKQRINNAVSTNYADTFDLKEGIYKLAVTDAGCDGLNFWANPSAGSGSIQVKPTIFTTMALRGYFSGDFGCGFNQYFKVGNPSTGIINYNAPEISSLNVYPNPASDEVTIHIDGVATVKGKLAITDNTGKLVYNLDVSQNTIKLDAKSFQSGLYFVSYQSNSLAQPKVTAKLSIIK